MKNWMLLTFRQIREGGFSVFILKLDRGKARLLNALAWLVMSPIAVLAIIIIRVIRPFIFVRVGIIRSDRIGHFGVDAPLHLADMAIRDKKSRVLDLFYISKNTCNTQWARMVRRQLLVYWWVIYLVTFNQLIPGGRAHQPSSINGSRDVNGLFYKTDVRFEFTDEEEDRAKSWLKKRGWTEGEPFICLLARDSKYMGEISNNNWHYHNYRDTDIDTFNICIEELVSKGYWLIRMGKTMHKKLSLCHPHVIDYPFVDDQDDLMDIWLTANCHFLISTLTGLDSISEAYTVPTVYVDVLPLGILKSYTHSITVPKHLSWKDTGNDLTLCDHLTHSYLRTEDYERAGIEFRELTEEEIFLAVNEMEQRLAGKWQATVEDEMRQKIFWNVLKAWPKFALYHANIHPEAYAGASWLKSIGDDQLCGQQNVAGLAITKDHGWPTH